MDRYEAYAEMNAARHNAAPVDHPGPEGPRSFLFLQGPISTFFDRLGRALIARGHDVHRVNLHLGDQLLWRLPATHFRGRIEDWRGFVGAQLDRHKITDLVLHGDRRPYHLVAAEEARARGIAVIATDLGYVRPDWITLEYDGMTTYSRFPRDPAAIRALAAALPEPELAPRFQTPFWMIAAFDVAYNLGLVLGRPLYPRYRYHSTVHPFAEYAGWLWSRAKKPFTAAATARRKIRLQSDPGSYFLVPLQIATDFQIRAHSPFGDVREAVREIIASFARSGSQRTLVLIVHPLDNGLIGWKRLIAGLAREFGVAERVLGLQGGTPSELLRNAAGIVTINSTVGVTALHHGVPVKVLGNAVFDVAGLTCQAPLDAFWHDPPRPDPELMAAFLRALIGTTQVKGGYYEAGSQACAIAGFIDRFERRLYPLPPLTDRDLAARPPRAPSRGVAVIGVSDGLGAALARAHAAPGVTLLLVGGVAGALARAAEDCRRRGSGVATFCSSATDGASLALHLAALDRVAPLDRLVVLGIGSAEMDGRPAEIEIEPDIGAVISAVAVAAEPMRRRGRGDIVLVDNLVGRPATADSGATPLSAKALLGHGDTLRRQLAADGVSVAVVLPGALAIRAAAWLGQPRLAIVEADRIAAMFGRAARRRGDVIGTPGAALVVGRVLRLLRSRALATIRSLLPAADPVAAARDEDPLVGKSASGD